MLKPRLCRRFLVSKVNHQQLNSFKTLFKTSSDLDPDRCCHCSGAREHLTAMPENKKGSDPPRKIEHKLVVCAAFPSSARCFVSDLRSVRSLPLVFLYKGQQESWAC
ncbi:Hypothetical predicted protein [Xyrichtys novacula]|uniref:Uncharacterized protein n=1 Tax=Xyrichtys novacula TaxID=13765 RepID=A0AAV1G3F8_XYRNO|nr:Hypothetical predicted protein [Xyrichtys novacula]